jgi:hypothetical protein
VPGVAGMVENRDADRRAVDQPGVVTPAGGLPPAPFRADFAGRVLDAPAAALFHRHRHPGRHQAGLLGVAQGDLVPRRRGEGHLEVDSAACVVLLRVHLHRSRLGQQDLAGGAEPVQLMPSRRPARPGRRLRPAARGDDAVAVEVGPQIRAVHIPVPRPHATVVRVIAGLIRQLGQRQRPGHQPPAGAPEIAQERPRSGPEHIGHQGNAAQGELHGLAVAGQRTVRLAAGRQGLGHMLAPIPGQAAYHASRPIYALLPSLSRVHPSPKCVTMPSETGSGRRE